MFGRTHWRRDLAVCAAASPAAMNKGTSMEMASRASAHREISSGKACVRRHGQRVERRQADANGRIDDREGHLTTVGSVGDDSAGSTTAPACSRCKPPPSARRRLPVSSRSKNSACESAGGLARTEVSESRLEPRRRPAGWRSPGSRRRTTARGLQLPAGQQPCTSTKPSTVPPPVPTEVTEIWSRSPSARLLPAAVALMLVFVSSTSDVGINRQERVG